MMRHIAEPLAEIMDELAKRATHPSDPDRELIQRIRQEDLEPDDHGDAFTGLIKSLIADMDEAGFDPSSPYRTLRAAMRLFVEQRRTGKRRQL